VDRAYEGTGNAAAGRTGDHMKLLEVLKGYGAAKAQRTTSSDETVVAYFSEYGLLNVWVEEEDGVIHKDQHLSREDLFATDWEPVMEES
jgi:hypothetical protein